MDAFEKKQTTKALSVGILYYIYIYTSFLPSDNIFNGKSMKMTNFFAIFLSTRRKSRKYEEKYQKINKKTICNGISAYPWSFVFIKLWKIDFLF